MSRNDFPSLAGQGFSFCCLSYRVFQLSKTFPLRILRDVPILDLLLVGVLGLPGDLANPLHCVVELLAPRLVATLQVGGCGDVDRQPQTRTKPTSARNGAS